MNFVSKMTKSYAIDLLNWHTLSCRVVMASINNCVCIWISLGKSKPLITACSSLTHRTFIYYTLLPFKFGSYIRNFGISVVSVFEFSFSFISFHTLFFPLLFVLPSFPLLFSCCDDAQFTYAPVLHFSQILFRTPVSGILHN